MGKDLQLIFNFQDTEEVEDFLNCHKKAEKYELQLCDINSRLRVILKHCDLEKELRRELEAIRIISIIKEAE